VAGCRTDEYDYAFPLLDHVRHRGTGQSQHGMDMNIESIEPPLFGDVKESAGDGSARGMNQNIEAPPTGDRFGNGACTILSDACIRLNVKNSRDICCWANLQRFGRIDL
jgi:hypothetical protein